MAIQRVDNYAAGFIRAGAKAVVAEAHMGPAYYVRSLLRSQDSIEQIWRSSPSNNGHTMTLSSERSQGFSERLDPDRSSSGFHRSLVSKGVSSNQVRLGATGTSAVASILPQVPVTPSLVSLGLTFGQVNVRSLPIATRRTELVLPVANKGAKKIPEGTQVGVRWDPLVLDAKASPTAGTSPPATTASPAPSASASPPAAAASPAPSTSPAPIDPPDVDLVVPEQLGSVVTLDAGQRQRSRAERGRDLPVRPRPVPPGRHPPRPERCRLRRADAGQADVRPRARGRPVHGGLRRAGPAWP